MFTESTLWHVSFTPAGEHFPTLQHVVYDLDKAIQDGLGIKVMLSDDHPLDQRVRFSGSIRRDQVSTMYVDDREVGTIALEEYSVDFYLSIVDNLQDRLLDTVIMTVNEMYS